MIPVYWFVSSALLLFLIFQPVLAAEAGEAKRVLVLYSEDRDNPGQEEVEQGIRAGFRSIKPFEVHLYTEYLDASRFGDVSHARLMADFLRRKYAGMQIHVIVTVYPHALYFLLAERQTLFSETPVIAAAIPRGYAEKLERSPARRSVTGTIARGNLAALIDDALRLRPKTKRIAVVAGTSPNDILNDQQNRTVFERYAGKVDLIDLTKLSMEDTLSRVGSLSPDTIVFYSSIFRDGAGKGFVPREALSLIASASKVPVFGFFEGYLGLGIVGGQLLSLKKHGSEAAGLALRVMGGESAASIPFGGEQAYVTAYDWRELKRWGISEKALPPGSRVEFKSPSIWEEHQGKVLGGLSFMGIEALLIIALIVNLRKRRQAEIAGRRYQNELAHVTRVAAMGELTSSLAHELNQPLAAIRNYANAAQRLLSQKEPNLAKVREALEGIVRDDKRAAEVISGVRGLLKKEEPGYRPVNLNHVIEEILAFIRSDPVLEGLSIETEFAPKLPAVMGDRVQLQQVLLNLILNAIEAMKKEKPDSGKIVVKTEIEKEGGVRVSVKDLGAGLDEANKDKLFEPFYTTKPGGMGMGLAISARIIHAHGGSIGGENNSDRGATFSFTLPNTAETQRLPGV